VVIEAMALGKPVVCFDIAGPGFHIDQTCGIKITPQSPVQAVQDMAEASERLYDNRELRVKLGNGARQKAIQKYDWNVLGDRLYAIYKKAL
jgi:glycosyltransferase involved in cell wall biosynthesis